MIGGMVIAGFLIPVVVNHTSWRNGLLNEALQPHGLSATAASSTGGWLTAFEFHQVVIQDQSGHVQCRIDRLQTDQTILSHLSGSEEQSSITLIHPRFDIALDDQGRLPLTFATDAGPGDFHFQVERGALQLRVPWREVPVLDLEELRIQGSVVQDAEGRWLTVDAVDLMDHTRLSLDHTRQNLALVAPLISQTESLQGTVSAELQPIRICLDQTFASDQPLLQGRVQIHSLQAQLTQEWSQKIAQLTQFLGSPGRSDPLQILSSASVEFCVTPQGIHHQGFTLTLPEIGSGLSVASHGVLGLDERLDMGLTVQVPMMQPSSSSLLNSLTHFVRAPLQLRIVGTVSEPQIIMPNGNSLAQKSETPRDSVRPAGYQQRDGSSNRPVMRTGASSTQPDIRQTRSSED